MREFVFKESSWQQYENIILKNKKLQKKFHEIIKKIVDRPHFICYNFSA